MKRKLLSIILALSALFTCTFSVFGSGCNLLPQKDDFTKRVEAVMDNCTISVRGLNVSIGGYSSPNPQTFTYKFTKTRLYLWGPSDDIIAATWVAENGTYKYWKLTTVSSGWQEVSGKTKSEYNNARKNSFDLFFGYLTQKSSMFELNESKTQYTNTAPVELSVGEGDSSINLVYSNIIINLDEDGAIQRADYDLSMAYNVGGYTQLETYDAEVNFIGSTSVDIPNE